MDACSGGAKAGWLGCGDKNDLQWRNVYSEEGGEYVMTLSYVCGENRNVYVAVNDEEAVKLTLNSGGWSTLKTTQLHVKLNPGMNRVRLYNPSGWMPDIDCMTLQKEGSFDILNHQLESMKDKARNSLVLAVNESVKKMLTDALEQAGQVVQEEVAIETAIQQLQSAIEAEEAVRTEYIAFNQLVSWCDENLAHSQQSESLAELTAMVSQSKAGMSTVCSKHEAQKVNSDLKEAIKTYLKSADSQLKDNATWDMTILLTNPTFDSNTSGWVGSATYGHGAAEFWNKTFNCYQTLTGLKNGKYRVEVSALYRTEENDAGSKYASGKEVIPAKFYANTVEVPIASLYSYKYDGNTNALGSTDLKNGYVNSMYMASLSFAGGHYKNVLDVVVSDGKLKVGVMCQSKLLCLQTLAQ